MGRPIQVSLENLEGPGRQETGHWVGPGADPTGRMVADMVKPRSREDSAGKGPTGSGRPNQRVILKKLTGGDDLR